MCPPDYKNRIELSHDLAILAESLGNKKDLPAGAIKDFLFAQGIVIPSSMFPWHLIAKHKTLGELNKLVPHKYFTNQIGDYIIVANEKSKQGFIQ